jgi:hypothetical protein
VPFTPIDGCHLRIFLGGPYAYLEVPFTPIFVDLDGFCFAVRGSFVYRFTIEQLTVNMTDSSRAVFKALTQHVWRDGGKP